ncbi:MAG: P-loop NTPase, partial [Rhodothermales bacterium]|nr:P-loop NTPase [Rhodothermales bacterium]
EWLREDAIVITAEAGKDEADLIHIKATAAGPGLVAAMSSQYAASYMSLLRSAVLRQRDAALEAQRARVAEVGSELTALDEQLREFVQTTGSISIEADAQRAATRISDLQTSLDEARIAFSTHSATLETLEAEFEGLDLDRLADRVASSVESEISATQSQLTTAELSLEQYYSKYPELRADASSSPQVQKLVDDVAAMRRRLDALSDQYVREVMESGGLDLANDAEGRAYILRLRQQIAQERVAKRAAEARVAAITNRLDAFERSRSKFSEQSVSLTQLQRSRELTGDRLKDEIDRLGLLQLDEPTEFVKQIQAAIVPDRPAFPNVKLVLAIGFVLGILLGGGVAYGWSSIDSTVHGDEDLAHLGVPVRGRLPDLKRMVRKTVGKGETVDLGARIVSSKLVVVHAPQAAESALIRKYALGLVARTPRGGSVLFTSPDVGAGKTTVTANVAAALSLAGYRTLVIDADIFRHGQTAMLGLTTRSALDVHTGTFGPGGGVEQFGGMMQLLFGLTLRAHSPADSEAQAANAALNLARFYGQHFDYILIDTPPTSASSIAASVGPYTHSRVMVVGAGKTPKDLVAMALSELQSAGATPSEIVINRMDMSAPTAVRDAYQQARTYYGGATPS